MENKDIRWIQRFNNFCKALGKLTKFIEKGELNELEEHGLIKSFEYNYELAWSTIKDFYEYQGDRDIQGSRDAIRLAFNRGLIENGEIWMEMTKSRNLTTHTYNEDTAKEILEAVVNNYYPEFVKIQNKLELLAKKEK